MRRFFFWFLGWAIIGTSVQAATLDRDRDPIVLDGASLAALVGLPPAEIVAFRYAGGWQQIPVQVDERKLADFGDVYNENPTGLLFEVYADAGTYTGADTDPVFDTNDELVFMAGDAGDQAVGVCPPANVVAGSGVEIDISDLLDGGTAYVYLFRSDGTLVPGAGQDYVTYTFNLLAGPYIPNYNTLFGPNPEDTVAATAHYETHFADRWIRDEVHVFAGSASGVDILDRHKVMLGPGNCGRTEDTFSAGEGAFIANIDGPVRAIRSYLGSNSGPATQRDHLFYARRQDVVTYLRVHGGIAGVMDLYDYSPDAIGMSYYNELNQSGVVVDGQPDAVTVGVPAWEMVTGTQGALVMSSSMTTDIFPINDTLYYSDDDTPGMTQCTGDAFEYATSGYWVDQVMPNTDPFLGIHNNLTMYRTVFYEPPGQTVVDATARDAEARAPLATAVQPFAGGGAGDYDGDGDVDLDDHAEFATCLSGPGIPADLSCLCAFDLDADADVDLADFGGFQIVFGL